MVSRIPEMGSIEEQIKKLIAQSRSTSMKVAFLMLAAKNNHFERCQDWLDWAKDTFSFSRRHCFRLANVAAYIESLPEGLVPHVALDLEKIDSISVIPPKRLRAFLRKHDVALLDRDELRDAINLFMDREARPVRFLGYARIPDPDLIRQRMEHPDYMNRLDMDIELNYVEAHLACMAKMHESLDKSVLMKLRQYLDKEVQAIDKELFVKRKS